MKKIQFTFAAFGCLFLTITSWSFPIVAEKNFAMNCMAEYNVSASIKKEFAKKAVAQYGKKQDMIGFYKMSAVGYQTGYLLYLSSKDEWTAEESKIMKARALEIWNSFYTNKTADETDRISSLRTKECDARLEKNAKDQMLKRMLANDEWFQFLPLSMQFNF